MKTITFHEAMTEGLTPTGRPEQYARWPQCRYQQWETVADLARATGLDRTTIMEAIHRGKIPHAVESPWRVEMGYFTTWWLGTYQGRGCSDYRWNSHELKMLDQGCHQLPGRSRMACKLKRLRLKRKGNI